MPENSRSTWSTFTNRCGFWMHRGPYLIELMDGVATHDVPKRVNVIDNIITVIEGRITYSPLGGFAFFAGSREEFFTFLPLQICYITADSELLWIKPAYQNSLQEASS
ncbi:MAG: hypothetical protein COT39_03260 [Parcubacteria group bacterium CG08_land_8_20_14_0_20_48_21]|nr:MAG: hypothetical protein AUK21_04475 [Parcubacteria group bacterium CG2_30_48_51]PIS32690.1 MAG: hypothetical protein COT39_03260 [Parcubacteria group bacterium CG08_land_8_20_14_0_20_48_21]PIW79031.1 MAG: hypothetical protein COZ99_03360 [Parcubacteria group bacterium CG_4_8_14_3_um_filter_48_16]PIY77967.1 MAG: hypothetical protein COY83_02495 [Parcubacteria group bacterium CG_4_10_14_0_8_um_filter_48_154]PIZ77570.1 MAG: hypothetical protein COY03_02500 [bacterium CG_4_10_14_0_2_um_filter_